MTIKEAFNIYLKDNPEIKLSVSKFEELRPEYILPSSKMPHNVCVCIYHANFRLWLEILCKKKIINNTSSEEFLKLVCCDITKESCMCFIFMC